MNLRGIVAVSGKPGLFKLVGQNKVGYILESLDDQKTKFTANMANTKLASLEDITVYGEDEEIKLADIFANMAEKDVAIDPKGDAAALKTYFGEVAAGYDQEKVYGSDMKKIATWYNIIKDMPLFTEEAVKEEVDAKVAETKTDKKSKGTVAKPANAKATSRTSAPAKKASMTSKKGV
ncbi:hypothetical protein ABIB40_002254 [Pedobacter sp. UYP30]|uniref:DUF5606 family protein n=1 Tax=Pedobacter sp. UYP30 TaxID=1756400 RepID=UPI0033913C42